MRAQRTLALASLALCACGVAAPLGLEEPVRVERAMLVPSLVTSENSAVAVTAFENPSAVVAHRQRGKLITGRASREAFALAVRLRAEGTGYWVLPLGAPDPSANDELSFEATLSFSPALAAGVHTVELRAVDRDGRAGAASTFPLCVLGPVPDNLNVCDATIAPPIAVLSLAWDSDVDLDLEVELPDGRRVSAKRPATGSATRAPGAAFIDTDAGAHCVHDGARRENFVLDEAPALGRYRVFASLFDACGERQVFARATLHRRALGPTPGSYAQVETARADAQLLAFNVGAGERGAHLVTEFSLP